MPAIDCKAVMNLFASRFLHELAQGDTGQTFGSPVDFNGAIWSRTNQSISLSERKTMIAIMLWPVIHNPILST